MHNDHTHSKLYTVRTSLALYYCAYKDATLSKQQYIESVEALKPIAGEQCSSPQLLVGCSHANDGASMCALGKVKNSSAEAP